MKYFDELKCKVEETTGLSICKDTFASIASKFSAEGDEEVVEEAEEVAEEVAAVATTTTTAAAAAVAPAPKKKGGNGLWGFVKFLLLVYALIISFKLNTDMRYRSYLGFTNSAGMLKTILSLLGVFFVGPIVYLFLLFTNLLGNIFKTKNGKSWMSAVHNASLSETGTWHKVMAPVAMIPVIGGQ